MKLPNGRHALIPMSKIVGYCLNTNHHTGKHKARVFASALGITASNAERLQTLVRKAAIEGEVVSQLETNTGQQYKVDWEVPDSDQVILRTIWEIASSSSHPRLVSAFIK